MLKIKPEVLKSILVLDAEFDKTVAELMTHHEQMTGSEDYEDIALHALMAKKCEQKAEGIFKKAISLLEV